MRIWVPSTYGHPGSEHLRLIMHQSINLIGMDDINLWSDYGIIRFGINRVGFVNKKFDDSFAKTISKRNLKNKKSILDFDDSLASSTSTYVQLSA